MTELEKAEKRLQKTLREQRQRQDVTNKRFTEIMENMKAKISESTKQKLREEIQKTTLNSQMVEVELEYTLNKILRPYALQKLAQEEAVTYKQVGKPCTRHLHRKLTYLLETTLTNMLNLRNIIIQSDISELLLHKTIINSLISVGESWNQDVNQLHLINEKFTVLQPVLLPTETNALQMPNEIYHWLTAIQNNQILNDEWFNHQRKAIQRFLR
jgi:hypothetical protein